MLGSGAQVKAPPLSRRADTVEVLKASVTEVTES